jgi:hypothetical protein
VASLPAEMLEHDGGGRRGKQQRGQVSAASWPTTSSVYAQGRTERKVESVSVVIRYFGSQVAAVISNAPQVYLLRYRC